MTNPPKTLDEAKAILGRGISAIYEYAAGAGGADERPSWERVRLEAEAQQRMVEMVEWLWDQRDPLRGNGQDESREVPDAAPKATVDCASIFDRYHRGDESNSIRLASLTGSGEET